MLSVQLLKCFLSIKLASVAHDSSCAVGQVLLKEMCRKLSFLQVDDERVAEELFREQAGSSASQKTDRGGSVDRDDRWGDIYEDMPMKRKIALYDYDPTELSQDVDSRTFIQNW